MDGTYITEQNITAQDIIKSYPNKDIRFVTGSNDDCVGSHDKTSTPNVYNNDCRGNTDMYGVVTRTCAAMLQVII